ncbi:MAG TPA: twin-arginine translocase subunit TatC [Bacteroidales bacterium]|nr:twin-arginine translocase subunit TatC [Bacteroidales bacterium]
MDNQINPSDSQSDTKPRSEMTFWQHLAELRGTLVRSSIFIAVFSLAAFLNRNIIFDQIILLPKSPDFITNRLLCRLGEWTGVEILCIGDTVLQLISIHLSGQLMMHLYVSLAAGFVIASPLVISQFYRFIRPALTPHERLYTHKAVIVVSLLFWAGVLFSYFLIVPLTISFLGNYQVSEAVVNQITLNSYVGTIVSVSLAVGLVFELPVLVFFLARTGVVTADFLKRNRKYMLVIILILSAIITPPDIFSQILVSIPLLGLYEVSIAVAKRTQQRQLVA